MARLMAFMLGVIVCGHTAGAEGDPKRGEQAFIKCRICHQIGPGASHGIGPALTHIFNATAGTREGYRYSAAMKSAGENGLDWTEKNLVGFLRNSKAYFPGNKHVLPPMSPSEVDDVVAYLKEN